MNTRKGMITMKNEEFEKILLEIIKSLEERGYNAYDQLQGYLAKGDSSYITRHNDARDKIETLDKEQIKKYISEQGR